MTTHKIPTAIDQSTPEYNERVAQLNDLFRETGQGDCVLLTPSVSELGVLTIRSLQRSIAEYTYFTPQSDPSGRRDSGILRIGPEHVFWKINYFDSACRGASEDPANPAKTCRMLAIMYVSEVEPPTA